MHHALTLGAGALAAAKHRRVDLAGAHGASKRLLDPLLLLLLHWGNKWLCVWLLFLRRRGRRCRCCCCLLLLRLRRAVVLAV